MEETIRLPYEQNLAVVKRGWVEKRISSNPGTEVRLGLHIIRPTKALLDEILEQEALERWYNRPDPERLETAREKVKRDYAKDKLEIKERARRILHHALVEIVGKKYYDCIQHNKDDPEVRIEFAKDGAHYKTIISDLVSAPGALPSRTLTDMEEIDLLKEQQKPEPRLFGREWRDRKAKQWAVERELLSLEEKYPLNLAIFVDTEAGSIDRIKGLEAEFFGQIPGLTETRILSSREKNGGVRQSTVLHVMSPKYDKFMKGDDENKKLEVSSELLRMIFQERAEELCALNPKLNLNEVKDDLFQDYEHGEWDLVRTTTHQLIHDSLLDSVVRLGANYSNLHINPYSPIIICGHDYKCQIKIGKYLNYLGKMNPTLRDWTLTKGWPEIRKPEHVAFEQELADEWQRNFERRNCLGLTQVIEATGKNEQEIAHVMNDLSFIAQPFTAPRIE